MTTPRTGDEGLQKDLVWNRRGRKVGDECQRERQREDVWRTKTGDVDGNKCNSITVNVQLVFMCIVQITTYIVSRHCT